MDRTADEHGGMRSRQSVALTIRVVCGLFLVVLALPVRAENAAVSYPDDIARIKKRGTLLVAQFKGSRPGFFMEDDGARYPGKQAYTNDGRRLVGYDIDLAHRIARELGVSVTVVRTFPDFNAVCRSVASQETDIAISKLSVTYNRSQFVLFSRPYVTLRMGLLINRLQESQARRGADPMKLCNDPAARIGIVSGTSFVDFGEELFPRAQRVTYSDKDALFKAVRAGEVLAVFYEEFEIRRTMRLHPDTPIYCREVYLPGREDHISMAVNPGSATLLSLVNLLLAREGLVTTVDNVLDNYLPRGELSGRSEVSALSAADPVVVMLTTLFLLFSAGWMWASSRARGGVALREGAGREGGAAP